ncbi:hypothetical protein Fmac_031378 [Flemingia macrophylla]|uniref:Alkyl transferase n=1 Tax=Flemingia macrophylla TaxID=520843 RepID=A0ABD1L1V7_9FABA
MLSLRLPVPLLNTLTPPNINIKPINITLSSQTHPPIVSKRISNTAPPSAAIREEGTAVAGESPESLPAELVAELMPKHVAVIMDGNGRWAKLRGLPESAGHRAGLKSLAKLAKLCGSWGVEVLTVFMFSTQNWLRPKEEVDPLLRLAETALISTTECMKMEGIRFSVIGDLSDAPRSLQRLVIGASKDTKHNSRLQLIVAASYSGKYDVVQACKSVAEKVKDGILHLDDINENIIEQELETKCTEFPYPDLLIRTGGDFRVSNFLMWQLSYTELYFTSVFWPDFGKDDFLQALISFQQRKRTYGRRESQ